jgi:acetate kinase
MKILVFNAGSSSLKFGVFDMSTQDSRQLKGEFEAFGAAGCTLHLRVGGEQGPSTSNHHPARSVSEAIDALPHLLTEQGFAQFDAVGHRVAHGGEQFHEATLIDDNVLAHIEACTPLAPLHNPSALQAIARCRALWPQLPQIAVFDTAFHHTIPERAYTYAVPKRWREHGLRRYGFHGTSHKYVALRVASTLGTPVTELKIISCHLGNGASVCAINRGFSVDTSMGMTPLEGLVMGSRSGDVDPGMFAYLARELGLDAQQVEAELYSHSGLKALAGNGDMRTVEQLASEGNADAQLAISVYAYRVRKYIGAYAAAMGGVDVIAFTGGIGENSASMRRRICDRFEFLGLHLDEDANLAVKLQGYDAPQIQRDDSRIRVVVTQTNEQYMIAQETAQLLERNAQPASGENVRRVPVAVSARHVHLSQESVEKLFGQGHQLRKQRNLKQPGSWAAEETVEVIGPKGSITKVRVLGPVRSANQIEVSRTDTFVLGIDAPVRPSGKLNGTPSVRLRGPAGELLTNGIIIAARHIHMHPDDAKRIQVDDGDYVDVRVGSGERSVLFANTLIRVSKDFALEMHIDTDEANAAGISTTSMGELILTDETTDAHILHKCPLTLKDGQPKDHTKTP